MKFIIVVCMIVSLLGCNNAYTNVKDDFHSVGQYITNGDLKSIKAIVNKDGASSLTKVYGLGLSLLSWASAYNQTDIMKYLLEQGADPNYCPEEGYSPLLNAAFSGGIESVKLLVEHGARVDEVAQDGKTAYLAAAGAQKIDVCKFLLSKGADGAGETNGGLDALSGAMCGSDKIRVSTVRFLIENGADSNREIYCGEPTTPLMMAAKTAQNKEIYDYLISVGADASYKDPHGKTAQDYLSESKASGK